MVNALNVAAWSGAYATSLWAAGKVVGSTAKQVYDVAQFTWDGVGGKGWNTKSLQRKSWSNLCQFGEGVKWVGIALLIRQAVAYLFTPVAPTCVTKGLELVGWQHVRSPAVDYVANKLPFNVKDYVM